MSISLAKRFCLGAAVVTLSLSCATSLLAANWPMFRHDLNHTGSAGESVGAPLKLAWSADLGEKILSSPAVVDGVVYVGSRLKTLTAAPNANGLVVRREVGALNALDARSGKLLWKYVGTQSDPIGWVDSSPSVLNGVIYFATRDGFVYAIDTKGHLKWKYKSGGSEISSPMVANGLVYIGSGFPNKDILALDAATGKLKWKVVTDQMVYSSASVVGKTVYIGSDDGKFYALDAATGKEKWSFNTKGGVFCYSPLVAEGKVFCVPGDFDAGIYALDANSGKLIWKAESDSSDNYLSSAAYKDGRLYVGTCKPGHKLFALDAQNGKVLWRVPVGRTTGQMFTSSPAISGKTVYLGAGPQSAGDDNGRVLALDAASGRSIWEYGTKDPVISSPAISNGMIYVGTLGGTLHAFAGNVETVKKAKTTHKRKH